MWVCQYCSFIWSINIILTGAPFWCCYSLRSYSSIFEIIIYISSVYFLGSQTKNRKTKWDIKPTLENKSGTELDQILNNCSIKAFGLQRSGAKVHVLTPDCRANISTSSTFHPVTRQPPVAVSLRGNNNKRLSQYHYYHFWVLASNTPDYLAWQTNWQSDCQHNGG